jgi:CHAD domain-containing protein
MINIVQCCYKVIKKQLEEIEKYEEGVLKNDDIEDVHQMRVAARRLRAAIKFFSPVIKKKQRVVIAKDLKFLAKNLGRVRDLDVSILYFQEYLKENPENVGVLYLLERYAKARETRWKGLVKFLKSKKHKKLKKHLEQMKKKLKKNASVEIDISTYQLFSKSFSAIIDEVYSFQDHISLYKEENLLHDLRIAIKYLRYSLEFINLENDEARKIVKYTKKMQNRLGVINDCNFMNDKLNAFLHHERLSTEIEEGIQELIAYNKSLKNKEKEKLSFPWEKIPVDAIKEQYMSAQH